MSGLVFFRTENSERAVEWYAEVVGADVWLERPGRTTRSFEGFRFGFCDGEETDECGVLTFVSDDRASVDADPRPGGRRGTRAASCRRRVRRLPVLRRDPDGRTAGFRTVLHETPDG